MKGKLKEAKFNKTLYSILYKLYIVAIHYYQLLNMDKQIFKLNYRFIRMAVVKNQSNLNIYLDGIIKYKKHLLRQ